MSVFFSLETVADSSPALQNDNQDTLSGGGALEITTQSPVHHVTENSVGFDYEDSTPTLTLAEDEGEVIPIHSHLYVLSEDFMFSILYCTSPASSFITKV